MCVQQCARGRGWRLRARRFRPRRCFWGRLKTEATVLLDGAMKGDLATPAPDISRLCTRCLGSPWGAGSWSIGAAVVVGTPPRPTAAGGGGCETHAAERQVNAPEPSARHSRSRRLGASCTPGGGALPSVRGELSTQNALNGQLSCCRCAPSRRREVAGTKREGGGGSCMSGGVWRGRASAGVLLGARPARSHGHRGSPFKPAHLALSNTRGGPARQVYSVKPQSADQRWRATNRPSPSQQGVHGGSEMSPCSGGCSSAHVSSGGVQTRETSVARRRRPGEG